MRNIFVRTPNGTVVAHGDLYSGQKDSFGREIFENDTVLCEFTSEFGSKINVLAKCELDPICNGLHMVPAREDLTDLLNCAITDLIQVINEKAVNKITP